MIKLNEFNPKSEFKKLERRNRSNKITKLSCMISVAIIALISIIYTYANYNSTSDKIEFSGTTVSDFINGDYFLTFYMDGVAVLGAPQCDDCQVEVTCNDGARGIWNKNTKSITIYDAVDTNLLII